MSQLGEILNRMATQAGINPEDEGLKALLSNPTVSTYEISDNIVEGLSNGLMTMESAKNNPTIKNHYFAQALNGVDSELNTITSGLGLEQSILDELNAEKSSTKRVGLLINKIQALESAKANTNKDGKQVLQVEIDKLREEHNKEVLDLRSNNTQEIDTLKDQQKDTIKGILMQSSLNGYDYSLPVSKEVSSKVALDTILNELNKVGGKVVLGDNNDLELKNNEGQDLFINNEKAIWKTFSETQLSNHKLLKTVDAPTPSPHIPIPTPNVTGEPVQNNAFLVAANEAVKQFDQK